ncbi:hypothetical protein K461DRAFT_273931 [Myriangium duriaei CBS 260.36]|uniref:Uncharacterized protein n=1 Tax=Myriangium duriaei CBS 260.36 TaxID=1168546 RepID=A0A9P4MPY0_9PEZI|nr:hypothetical protein K461DRAFT_273931 [Myriangium duriaei CBS 260.36]
MNLWQSASISVEMGCLKVVLFVTLLFVSVSNAAATLVIYTVYFHTNEDKIGEESQYGYIPGEQKARVRQQMRRWSNWKYQAMWDLQHQRLRIFNTVAVRDVNAGTGMIQEMRNIVGRNVFDHQNLPAKHSLSRYLSILLHPVPAVR